MTDRNRRPITPRQREVLRTFADLAEATGPPTVRELAAAFGISPNAAADHLKALETHGCLVRVPRTARGIRLTDRGRVEIRPAGACDGCGELLERAQRAERCLLRCSAHLSALAEGIGGEVGAMAQRRSNEARVVLGMRPLEIGGTP